MTYSGIDERIKIQQIIENHLPEFVLSENQNISEFLKQYYISQEHQGASSDILNNLDQYLKLDNLTPDVISQQYYLTSYVDELDDVININTTIGFPKQYGLLKINNEIITYTGITTNSFTGCIRGFSGISEYYSESDQNELIFSQTDIQSHQQNTSVENLSNLFLKEFYKKVKYYLTPGLENVDFVSDLNVGNFIRESKSFYSTKGTEESFRILFNVLYGIDPKVVDLEQFLIKPSSSEYLRRKIILTELISGNDPTKLSGQTIFNSDNTASAPISEVEIFTRGGKSFYKLSVFEGYDDRSLIEGTFRVTPSTKVIGNVSVGDNKTITVDSTVGFPESGTLISGNNAITYSDKTINQFFNCNNVTEEILSTDDIRLDEYVYGYENGDQNLKVELKITGSILEFLPTSDIELMSENDKIYINSLGDYVKDQTENKTKKDIIFNSWIYNTCSRYEVQFSESNTKHSTKEVIDKSSLKVNDRIDILLRGTETIVANATVKLIDQNIIELENFVSVLNLNIKDVEVDFRRKIDFATSINNLKYDNMMANVLNTYNENDKYIYVASNCLPSNIETQSIGISILNASSEFISDNSISFNLESIPFSTGDEVVYISENENSDYFIGGLQSGTSYFVEKISGFSNKIRLYLSRSFIPNQEFIELTSNSLNSVHTFYLKSTYGQYIIPKKNLLKIPLENLNSSQIENKTINNKPVGVLIDGVEISNYKSLDKVYYGPISNVSILNFGSNYDVVNPPLLEVSSGLGVTALVQPHLDGSLVDVFLEDNDIEIDFVNSLSVVGGNGSGAKVEPIIERRYKEIEFIAGTGLPYGVDIDADQIIFTTPHNLKSGEALVYNSNGNSQIGIGSYLGSNLDSGETLLNGTVYFSENVNSSTIKLYKSLNDYNLGINTIGFTTSNLSGVHKFRLLEYKNVLADIKVLNSGSNYQNKKLFVKEEFVDLTSSSIKFKNHGFNDGDIIEYSSEGSIISGLSTATKYKVLKLSDNEFRLSDVGINGENNFNYTRKNYVQFISNGFGYQVFKYPDIKIVSNVSYAQTGSKITAIPVVKGKINNVHVYEPGSGYGSSVINFHKKPFITVKTGKNAVLRPIILNGKIIDVEIQNSGEEYYSLPELVILGTGIGAKLYPVISNNRIVDVKIIKSGINYDQNTTIQVVSAGNQFKSEINVRELTVNETRNGFEILKPGEDGVFYSIIGYSENIKNRLQDNIGEETEHSPIIGWANDGNPIYGPYGHSNPLDNSSPVRLLNVGYAKSTFFDRPSGFGDGFFVEDFYFTDSGDLDIHNGRFSITPEFPNGVYAYYAGITTDTSSSNSLIPKFPYFVGDTFRSESIPDEFDKTQSYDFSKSNLLRNTFPYRVGNLYSRNDFIDQSDGSIRQICNVESTSLGSIDSFKIISGGSNYKPGDQLIFDNSGTNGSNLSAEVLEVEGENIFSINLGISTYNNSLLVKENNSTIKIFTSEEHNFNTDDIVTISGLSTNIIGFNRQNKINVSEFSTVLLKEIPSVSVVGFVTDIYVSNLDKELIVGNYIGIGTEKFKVLNYFVDNKVIRVERSLVGVSYSVSEKVESIVNYFTINFENNSELNSYKNDLVYFNPNESVGFGTISGISSSVNYSLGELNLDRELISQSIYIPNHKFKNNQEVIFKKPQFGNSIKVSNDSHSDIFDLPDGENQSVYIINKSKDYIGIVTQVGLTTTNGLYFRDYTSVGVSSDYKYSLETVYPQITAKVEKIVGSISISTAVNFSENDLVTLDILPNSTLGIGNSEYISVSYKNNKILIDPIGFTSENVLVSENALNLNSHKFETGNKVFYDSSDELISGISTGSYYVYVVDDNNIKLSEKYSDLFLNIPEFISIGSSGGLLQSLSKINPEIRPTKGNNLKFNLSDSTLTGYKLKIYNDSKFTDEFYSSGYSQSFNVVSTGIPGISTDASLTIFFDDQVPENLYYNLEKSGKLIDVDNDVPNRSKISYKTSVYSGKYNIFGVGSTTFNIVLDKIPEKNSYTQNDLLNSNFYTTSSNVNGPIHSIRIINSGNNYGKLPSISDISSENGTGALIIPQTKNIGKIESIKVLNEGFSYPSDITLRPRAVLPTISNLLDNGQVSNVDVVYGGRNYYSAPKLVLVDSESRKVIDNGAFNPILSNNSIIDVEIISSPKGLSFNEHTIFTLNNTNGVGISTISYNSFTGDVTCTLFTPISGFPSQNQPFKIGDLIFVEGIENADDSSLGFNSEDHGFVFFKVTDFINTNPAILKFNLSEYTTNAGIPRLTQTRFATIVNQNFYPIFSVSQENSIFEIGEKLRVNVNGDYQKTDLVVSEFRSDYLKIIGSYPLENNDTIKGEKTGSISKISQSKEYSGTFSFDYYSSADLGWKDEVGKISLDTQRLPDNDYYQNLSYTVKSPIEYQRLIDPVNRLVHTVGLKNFADLGITTETKYDVNNASIANIVIDLLEDNRVDTISSFDTGIDFDFKISGSKFIDLSSKQLSNYIKCKSNRVLQIDDISGSFSSKTFSQEEFLDIITYPKGLKYSKFYVQTSGIGTNEYQFDDIVVLNDLDNSYTFNRGTISNSQENDFDANTTYVNVSGNIDEFSNLSLRVYPENPLDKSYEFKVYRNYFTTSPSGIGSTSFGFINLTSKTQSLLPNQSIDIIGISTETVNSIYAEVLIIDSQNNNLNFFEVILDHDGENTSLSEFYFDTTNSISGFSNDPIGSFRSEISSGIVKLSLDNLTSDSLTVKSRIIGIGTTSSGIGTYRFKEEEQPDNTERSIKFDCNYFNVSSASPIISLRRGVERTVKSLVRVKNNEKISLHEIILLNDDNNSFILPKYFLSINNSTGIGTFGSSIVGSDALVTFYPDQNLSGDFEIQTYNEIIYSDVDLLNESPDLEYGTIVESLITSQFNGINSDGNDRLDFEMNYQGYPIFKKHFNPSIPSVLDLSTGTFRIENHFLNTNEELIYSDGSTFVDILSSPLEISESLTNGVIFVGDIISGFSTISGISTTEGIEIGQTIIGNSIPVDTNIVSIGTAYKYFQGNVASGGSEIITGIANTAILTIGSGIFSGDGTSFGEIISIGISSVTSSVTIPEGNSIVYYSDEVGIGISLSNVSTSSTFRNSFTSGILTTICPTNVYALKVDNDRFRISAIKNSGIALTFTSFGSGNYHSFEMKKKNEKSLIMVDNIVQYPIRYCNIDQYLENNNGSIDNNVEFLSISGIGSIRPNDFLKVDNEYIKVINVGFGTTSVGPVSGIGTFNIIYGSRGYLGSISTSHNDGSLVQVYRGNYNVEGNRIYFSDPPKGTGANDGTNNSNLDLPRSSFNGRVFLRQDYTNNLIYDDISDEFNGIGQTYVVKFNGNDVTSIEPGSGLLYINEMFQTPTTENNEGNNYSLDIDFVNKTTKITFSGIRSPETDELIISDSDVNQNELPRGGIIVSLGSTSGLGFAPLVGASVTAVVGSGGSIVSVGLGTTDIVGSGYYNQVSVAVTDTSGYGADIRAIIGIGGTLTFNVVDGGSGYTDPQIIVSEPTYSNLPVTGVFRVGVGSTSLTGIGLSISLEVGPSYSTGIGSTYFEVKSFSISKNGYGFKKGDVIKPVGLVTAIGLESPLQEFELTVLDIFTDSSSIIQFGELDFIDSIQNLQDGIRRRFPLFRNSSLLSFETDSSDLESTLIDLDAVLVIFINGILQEPKVSYVFEGGTAFTFAEPPKPEDKIDIFFYRGTRDIDSFITGVKETIKVGDNVRISNSVEVNDPYNQESRTVFEILSSDSIETNIYSGAGINTEYYKPISWTKQKRDKIINSLYISKARDSLSSLVFPTSRLISNFDTDDLSLFVDNIDLYDYETEVFNEVIQEFDLVIVDSNNFESANLSATVTSGSISGISILSGGSGYTPGETISLKISSPIYSDGSRATANAVVSAAGTVSSISITNVGSGYTDNREPQVIAPLPTGKIETLSNASFIQGFSGIVTGITTSIGLNGNPLAITFYVNKESGTFSTLLEGYPIVISNTNVGDGIISIDNDDSSIIGIGTSFSDNIYKIHSISSDGNVAIVTSNILSSTDFTGINTEGEIVGNFSWGRISGFSRSQNPVSYAVTGYTINSGLTTFPQLQRRGFGLRDTGSIKK